MAFGTQNVADLATLSLCFGPSIGQGASGIVYPLVHDSAAANSLKREVYIEKGAKNDVVDKLAALNGSTALRYVAKEVKMDSSSRDSIMKEVELHKQCSTGCPGIVQFLFAGVTIGESPDLIVVMGACRGDMWDALIAFEDLTRTKSNGSKSGANMKPGLMRSNSCLSTSSITSKDKNNQQNGVSRLPTESERLGWSRCICDAVRHCHSLGVLHRDLNPWNILISAEEAGDGTRCVRLADFGLAVRLPKANAELKGLETDGAVPLDDSALGSLYSAPELGAEYGIPADIFSLGMVLLAIWSTVDVASEDALITCVESVKKAGTDGTLPPGNVMESLKGGCDADFRALVLRMVSAQTSKRPSASEAAEMVEQWLGKRGQGPNEEENIPRSGLAKFCHCLWPSPPRKMDTE